MIKAGAEQKGDKSPRKVGLIRDLSYPTG